MKRRGHPVRGAISGLFFGLFLGLDLSIWHVMPPGTVTIVVLPVLGLALGIVLGIAAPFKRRAAVASPE
jgi:hypothetical protein